jgi:SAM-dependent methyltransferase
MTGNWFDQDDFWSVAAPLLFTPERCADAAEEVDHLLSLLDLPQGAHVLDLCCGIGRHALELARRGYRVTAVDRTRHYLEQARDQAKEEGLTIEFVEADMRDFCRPASFTAAINLFSSFGYFEDAEDDRRVARNLAESLLPEGQLVVDTMAKEILARDFLKRHWSEQDGYLLLEERNVTHDWGRVETRWLIIPPDGERLDTRLTIRLYSAAELKALFEGCGFASTACYGNYCQAPFDETAKRLVVVARRGPS